MYTINRLTIVHLSGLIAVGAIMHACGSDKINIENCLQTTDECVGVRDVNSKNYLVCEDWVIADIQTIIHNAKLTRRSAQFLCGRMVLYFDLENPRKCYLRILFVKNGPPIIEYNNNLYASQDVINFLDRLQIMRPEIGICDVCDNYSCRTISTSEPE